MREQVYSIYRYHSSDYTVNRYLALYFSLELSLISTDYLSGGNNIQVSTNNYVRFASTLFRFAKIQRDYDINGIIVISSNLSHNYQTKSVSPPSRPCLVCLLIFCAKVTDFI